MIDVEYYPKVLPVERAVKLVAKLPAGLEISGQPRAFLYAFEGGGGDGPRELSADALSYIGGSLTVDLNLPLEQEYRVRIFEANAEAKKCLFECRVYAANEDLLSLRPLKGDFHMHSIRSDGKDQPVQVAVACRGIGHDFMALTDHRLYGPSLEAAKPFADAPLGFSIFPGEEVHPPNNPVHMINFGGRSSVNELFDDSSYKSEVEELAAKLEGFENKERRDQYASCVWCYNKIREIGGLGLFCHPYWVTGGRYNVCEELIERHFRDRPFDAYEVYGGFGLDEIESNTLQAARYNEERMHDPALPIVGASDSHGCDSGYLFGWYYTIVFAASSSLDDISAAVRELRSVAVAALPGQDPQVVGPFRLVKLALFLMREYMPEHDRLCSAQADAMQRYLNNPADSLEKLGSLHEKLESYHQRMWVDSRLTG